MTTPEARYARLRTTAVSVWAAIGILILIAVALWGLGKIAAALVPFVIAFILAFLLNWPVRALAARGMSRGTATIVCLLVGMLALGRCGHAPRAAGLPSDRVVCQGRACGVRATRGRGRTDPETILRAGRSRRGRAGLSRRRTEQASQLGRQRRQQHRRARRERRWRRGHRLLRHLPRSGHRLSGR